MSKSGDSDLGAFLILFGAGFGALVASPGLLLAFGASRALGLDWDTGQLWVAGVSAAAALFALLWVLCGFWRAAAAYGGVCALSLWFFCVARWGTKSVWTSALLSQVFHWNG